jgi:hypothetical protein
VAGIHGLSWSFSNEVSGAPTGKLAALHHLIIRCSCSGCLARLMIAFIVPGLETKSVGRVESIFNRVRSDGMQPSDKFAG